MAPIQWWKAEFCHRVLNSNVQRRYATICELDAAGLGGPFDLVFVGDLLLHTIDPLAALASAAAQCHGDLIIGQAIPDNAGQPPLLSYVGGAAPQEDRPIWWIPSLPWFQIVLKRLGFSQVEVVDRITHTVRPAGHRVETTVLHARRGPA